MGRAHCHPACRIPALYLRCRCTAGTAGARPEAGHRMGCGKGLQRRQDYIYHYGRSSLLQGLGKRPEGILLRRILTACHREAIGNRKMVDYCSRCYQTFVGKDGYVSGQCRERPTEFAEGDSRLGFPTGGGRR